MIIKEMKEETLPREKALRKGISSLSDAELLAIILRCGTVGKNALELASEILAMYKDFPTLAISQVASFCSIKGISEVKAVTLMSVFEIARRCLREAPYLSLTSPKEIFDHYRFFLGNKKNETLFIICYDKAKRIRKERIIAEGNENELCASTKMILSEINSQLFSYFIIIHNHPSGTILPSGGEIEFTLELAKASSLIGVKLLDHMIFANNQYFSFHENGFMD